LRGKSFNKVNDSYNDDENQVNVPYLIYLIPYLIQINMLKETPFGPMWYFHD